MGLTKRTELRKRNGLRFRCRAVVGRFGVKPAPFRGGHVQTIMLRDILDAETGAALTDHLWFIAGKWSEELVVGSTFEFDARVGVYKRAYKGLRVSRDWKLQRPTKVKIVPQPPKPVI
jgi:hypothetical protein